MKRWLGLALLLSFRAIASEIPEPVLPQGVGINIHFVTGHQHELDLIQAAGFKFVRMDFAWTATERQKGQYDWSEYEQLLQHLDQHGLRAILILDYSNPLYEQSVTCTNPMNNQLHTTIAAPQHPESIAAFARWAAAGVEHFRNRHVLWEIWNEPNIEFWSPQPDAQQYTTLALATCKAIRQVAPEATIIGPASSTFPWDFLETLLKSGALEYLDAVSVHPYRRFDQPPETAAADFHRLREMIDRYAPPGRAGKIPILSGEWGYTSATRRGVSLQTQAAFAVRQQLANLLEGVPLSIWYDLSNDGRNPAEREENFGTMYSNLKPKPAYLALQVMTKQLSGFGIAGRLPIGNSDDYLLRFTNSAGASKLVAWTLGKPHAYGLQLSEAHAAGANITMGDGSARPVAIDSGRLRLELQAMPQYVTLGMQTTQR
jgi:hypothetical protein